eukprot:TRINITY_DN14514_c2_g1_i3.p1 TRINITY_DN14514_c2_g1~~TRINITY_DN14514_c2_g1_i3.p1  ORF type:complete len:255 (-),score=27.08 TRINITY_DN14514_c2_g1_i3:560-1270(-)
MAWARYSKVLCVASALETLVCAFLVGMYCEHCFTSLSISVVASSISRTAALLLFATASRQVAHLVAGVAGSLQCCCLTWLLCRHGLYSLLPVAIVSFAITFAACGAVFVPSCMHDIWNDDGNERDVIVPADFIENGLRMTQETLRHLVPGANTYFDIVKGCRLPDAEAEFDIIGAGHCCFCLEHFNIGDEAMELLCNHLFHPNCLLRWRVSTYRLANSTVCPMRCRRFAEEHIVDV